MNAVPAAIGNSSVKRKLNVVSGVSENEIIEGQNVRNAFGNDYCLYSRHADVAAKKLKLNYAVPTAGDLVITSNSIELSVQKNDDYRKDATLEQIDPEPKNCISDDNRFVLYDPKVLPLDLRTPIYNAKINRNPTPPPVLTTNQKCRDISTILKCYYENLNKNLPIQFRIENSIEHLKIQELIGFVFESNDGSSYEKCFNEILELQNDYKIKNDSQSKRQQFSDTFDGISLSDWLRSYEAWKLRDELFEENECICSENLNNVSHKIGYKLLYESLFNEDAFRIGSLSAVDTPIYHYMDKIRILDRFNPKTSFTLPVAYWSLIMNKSFQRLKYIKWNNNDNEDPTTLWDIQISIASLAASIVNMFRNKYPFFINSDIYERCIFAAVLYEKLAFLPHLESASFISNSLRIDTSKIAATLAREILQTGSFYSSGEIAIICQLIEGSQPFHVNSPFYLFSQMIHVTEDCWNLDYCVQNNNFFVLTLYDLMLRHFQSKYKPVEKVEKALDFFNEKCLYFDFKKNTLKIAYENKNDLILAVKTFQTDIGILLFNSNDANRRETIIRKTNNFENVPGIQFLETLRYLNTVRLEILKDPYEISEYIRYKSEFLKITDECFDKLLFDL